MWIGFVSCVERDLWGEIMDAFYVYERKSPQARFVVLERANNLFLVASMDARRFEWVKGSDFCERFCYYGGCSS